MSAVAWKEAVMFHLPPEHGYFLCHHRPKARPRQRRKHLGDFDAHEIFDKLGGA